MRLISDFLKYSELGASMLKKNGIFLIREKYFFDPLGETHDLRIDDRLTTMPLRDEHLSSCLESIYRR